MKVQILLFTLILKLFKLKPEFQSVNILKCKWLYVLLKYLNFKISQHTYFTLNFNNLLFKKSNFIQKSDYYKSLCTFKELKSPLSNNFNTPNLITIPKPKQLYFFSLFKIFLRLNFFSPNKVLKVHATWSHIFLRDHKSNLSYINTLKFYTYWKRSYYLIFNLFYYKLDILFFGTSFLRKEITALNWSVKNWLKTHWRYIYPFMVNKPIKIFNYGWLVFYRLRLNGFNLALVTDVLYHSKTLYYLGRANFFTIGLTPLNYKANLLNFSLPTSSDSIFTQIFFLKLLISLKQETLLNKYSTRRMGWRTNYYIIVN